MEKVIRSLLIALVATFILALIVFFSVNFPVQTAFISFFIAVALTVYYID
jgi:hypothetical protein